MFRCHFECSAPQQRGRLFICLFEGAREKDNKLNWTQEQNKRYNLKLQGHYTLKNPKQLSVSLSTSRQLIVPLPSFFLLVSAADTSVQPDKVRNKHLLPLKAKNTTTNSRHKQFSNCILRSMCRPAITALELSHFQDLWEQWSWHPTGYQVPIQMCY